MALRKSGRIRVSVTNGFCGVGKICDVRVVEIEYGVLNDSEPIFTRPGQAGNRVWVLQSFPEAPDVRHHESQSPTGAVAPTKDLRHWACLFNQGL